MTARLILVGPDTNGLTLVVADRKVALTGSISHTMADEVIDCTGATIVPGAVNAHTHIYSGLAPYGLPDPEPAPRTFLQILERVWWKLDRALDERSLRAAARLYVAEALLAGTTLLVDHHESPNLIEGSLEILADACDELGMRALLCYGATERNGGVEEARRGLDECCRFIETNRRPLVLGAVGLHASFTVSDDTIRRAGDLCRLLGVPLHVHVAEDDVDVDDARKRGYDGPLARLHALGALVPRSILAHGIHLRIREARVADEARLWLVHNPRSNRANRLPYPYALAASSRVALGTDGFPSDMAVEAAALHEIGTHAGERREIREHRIAAGLSLAAEVFRSPFVPLRKGSAADAAVICQGQVRHLLVGGEIVIRDGRLLTGDIEEIRREAVAEADRLGRRMRRTLEEVHQ